MIFEILSSLSWKISVVLLILTKNILWIFTSYYLNNILTIKFHLSIVFFSYLSSWQKQILYYIYTVWEQFPTSFSVVINRILAYPFSTFSRVGYFFTHYFWERTHLPFEYPDDWVCFSSLQGREKGAIIEKTENRKWQIEQAIFLGHTT